LPRRALIACAVVAAAKALAARPLATVRTTAPWWTSAPVIVARHQKLNLALRWRA
jgi:hypothetical protein